MTRELSRTARENLVDILERELLGPAGGPEEILDGVPDVAYLVGRIAPVRLTDGHDDPGHDDPEDADAGEAATDIGDAIDAGESRGVPVTARSAHARTRTPQRTSRSSAAW